MPNKEDGISGADWNAPIDERLQAGGRFHRGDESKQPELLSRDEVIDQKWLAGLDDYVAKWPGKRSSIRIIDYVGNAERAEEINNRPSKTLEKLGLSRRIVSALGRRAAESATVIDFPAERLERSA